VTSGVTPVSPEQQSRGLVASSVACVSPEPHSSVSVVFVVSSVTFVSLEAVLWLRL
jgi:hypothetical protein